MSLIKEQATWWARSTTREMSNHKTVVHTSAGDLIAAENFRTPFIEVSNVRDRDYSGPNHVHVVSTEMPANVPSSTWQQKKSSAVAHYDKTPKKSTAGTPLHITSYSSNRDNQASNIDVSKNKFIELSTNTTTTKKSPSKATAAPHKRSCNAEKLQYVSKQTRTNEVSSVLR